MAPQVQSDVGDERERNVKMTVGSLVEIPAVGCRFLAGESGRDRPVTWAHVSELSDPWAWIGEYALLMTTGLGIPEGEAEQVEYIKQLNAHAISGVALGQNMSAPPLSAAMLRIADELGFPMLETKREIPFILLARTVASANMLAEQERLTRTERIYELTRIHLGDASETGLLDAIADLLGADVTLVCPDGPMPPGEVDEAKAIEHARLFDTIMNATQEGEPFLRLEGGRLVFPIVGNGHASLVLSPRSQEPVDISLAQHAATVVTARLSVEAAEFSREGQRAAALLARLLDGEIDSSAARDVLSARDLTGPIRVYIWNQSAPIDTGEATRRVFARNGVPNLVTIRDGHVVLFADSDIKVQSLLEASLPVQKRIGASGRCVAAGEVPGAFRQAKWALSRAEDLGRRTACFDDGDLQSVFLPHGREQLEHVVARVLGSLIAYDAEKNSQLLHSLRVFLEENRSWTRAAARLFVHKQTLVYRVERIEELAGRRLSSMADAAELWLAVQAATVIGILDADEMQP